jgi:glycosyltransferase involved in cell wall biosynthesis
LKSNLKVSVLVSTYNRLNSLKICLNNIKSQTYKNIEIIIINDCSDDGTEEFLNSLKDARLKIVHNTKNIVSKFGHTRVLKKALNISEGELIITKADDNYWIYKKFIEECVSKFNKHVNLSKVIGNQVNYYYSNFKEKDIDQKKINKQINLKKNIVGGGDVYWHKNIMPNGFLSSEDYLNLLANRPLDLNISTDGTLFNKKMFLESYTLEHKNVSKWQGGYELFIPSSFVGDIYFINKPSIFVEMQSTSMSFAKTQIEHMNDTIKSINNAFLNIERIKLNKNLTIKKLLRIKKKMISNTVKAYWHHSIEIFKNNKLSLCTDENIKKYVSLSCGMRTLIKNKILKINIVTIILYVKSFINFKLLK